MSSPCVWTIDTGCCPTWNDLSPEDKARAAQFGTDVMWGLTGRQFGTCPITVRPCFRNGYNGYAMGVWWWDGTFWPYILNGLWYNAACGCAGLCRCEPLPFTQAWLPGPVAGVSEVRVDGVVIDPASYRVDDAQWLVRQDGLTWPICQDYNLASGLPGTWDVTYFRGTPVPDSVLAAAGTLACEYAKACAGQNCRLPGRVSSIIRQGVSIQMVDMDTLIKNGYTGLVEVDQIIRVYNPGGLTHRLRLYSPDVEVNRVTTTT
jgi:hypothetical protein